MKKLIEALKKRTPLGYLQLKHESGKLITALAGVAFADILIMMQMGFINALFDSSVKIHQNLNTDLVMINNQALNWTELSTFSRRRLYQALDIPGVIDIDEIYVNSVRWKNPQTQQKTSILIVGIGTDEQNLKIPEVNQNLDKIKLPNTFLFDRNSRGEYKQIIPKIEEGANVTTEIERTTITIACLFNLGASFGADATLITSQENFLRLFPKKEPGTVSLGLIRLDPNADPQTVKRELNNHLGVLGDVRVMTLEEFIQMEKAYWARNRPVGIVFGFSMAIGFVVGIVLVYQVLSTDINAHIAEYATLKAMGYRQRYFLVVVFEQALILAILGFIPGVSVSFVLYNVIRKATYLPLLLNVPRASFVLGLTIIMCSISGAIAARRLESADPADIFH